MCVRTCGTLYFESVLKPFFNLWHSRPQSQAASWCSEQWRLLWPKESSVVVLGKSSWLVLANCQEWDPLAAHLHSCPPLPTSPFQPPDRAPPPTRRPTSNPAHPEHARLPSSTDSWPSRWLAPLRSKKRLSQRSLTGWRRTGAKRTWARDPETCGHMF